jgi:hypothetical protein
MQIVTLQENTAHIKYGFNCVKRGFFQPAPLVCVDCPGGGFCPGRCNHACRACQSLHSLFIALYSFVSSRQVGAVTHVAPVNHYVSCLVFATKHSLTPLCVAFLTLHYQVATASTPYRAIGLQMRTRRQRSVSSHCHQTLTHTFCTLPGGDRVYPVPGYWSPNENTPPI